MLIYISAPSPKPNGDKEQRFNDIAKYSGNLLKSGYHILCPMTLGINLTKVIQLPEDREFWMKWCIKLLSKCDEIHVLMFEGWEESIGVAEEIEFAHNNKLVIKYITI